MTDKGLRYIPPSPWYGKNDTNKSAGFSLMEVVAALGVAALLVSTLFEVYTFTMRVLAKLDAEMEIRDQGISAVENIERAFREAFESGARIITISDDRITVANESLVVTLFIEDEQLHLAVVQPSSETTYQFPHGTLRCRSLEIKALCGEEYVAGSRAASASVRLIVAEFVFGDRSQDVWKLFKAALRVN